MAEELDHLLLHLGRRLDALAPVVVALLLLLARELAHGRDLVQQLRRLAVLRLAQPVALAPQAVVADVHDMQHRVERVAAAEPEEEVDPQERRAQDVHVHAARENVRQAVQDLRGLEQERVRDVTADVELAARVVGAVDVEVHLVLPHDGLEDLRAQRQVEVLHQLAARDADDDVLAEALQHEEHDEREQVVGDGVAPAVGERVDRRSWRSRSPASAGRRRRRARRTPAPQSTRVDHCTLPTSIRKRDFCALRMSARYASHAALASKKRSTVASRLPSALGHAASAVASGAGRVARSVASLSPPWRSTRRANSAAPDDRRAKKSRRSRPRAARSLERRARRVLRLPRVGHAARPRLSRSSRARCRAARSCAPSAPRARPRSARRAARATCRPSRRRARTGRSCRA